MTSEVTYKAGGGPPKGSSRRPRSDLRAALIFAEVTGRIVGMGIQWHAARRTRGGFELIGLEREDRAEAEFDASEWAAEEPDGEYLLVSREVSDWVEEPR